MFHAIHVMFVQWGFELAMSWNTPLSLFAIYARSLSQWLTSHHLQILATTGDKKEGATHVLYDPAISERGALVCVARAPRKKSAQDFQAKPVVHNPHALPLFRDEPSRKRAREKARTDPKKSKRPDLPVTGPGFGGRVGTTKGSLLTQYLMRVMLCHLFFLDLMHWSMRTPSTIWAHCLVFCKAFVLMHKCFNCVTLYARCFPHCYLNKQIGNI